MQVWFLFLTRVTGSLTEGVIGGYQSEILVEVTLVEVTLVTFILILQCQTVTCFLDFIWPPIVYQLLSMERSLAVQVFASLPPPEREKSLLLAYSFVKEIKNGSCQEVACASTVQLDIYLAKSCLNTELWAARSRNGISASLLTG